MYSLSNGKKINIKNKIEKSNIILFNRPKYRFIGDLSYIPTELKINNNYLYIFIIIDHFSKLLNAYLLKNKDHKSIVNCMEKFFKYYGLPKEFGCDNGAEFLNKAVKNILEHNNIKMINGRPYQPHSQGVVERVHRTIRTGLVARYIENPNNYNIEDSLSIVVTNIIIRYIQ